MDFGLGVADQVADHFDFFFDPSLKRLLLHHLVLGLGEEELEFGLVLLRRLRHRDFVQVFFRRLFLLGGVVLARRAGLLGRPPG